MPIDLAYAVGSGVTVTDTETSLGVDGGTTTGVPVARTDAGLFQLFFDGAANMVKGDEYTIRVYEIAVAGGTVRKVFQTTVSDVQSEMFVMPQLLLGVGWDITADRTGGADRAVSWSVRRVS